MLILACIELCRESYIHTDARMYTTTRALDQDMNSRLARANEQLLERLGSSLQKATMAQERYKQVHKAHMYVCV